MQFRSKPFGSIFLAVLNVIKKRTQVIDESRHRFISESPHKSDDRTVLGDTLYRIISEGSLLGAKTKL